MLHETLTRLLRNVKGAEWAMVVGLDGVLLDACGSPAASCSETVAAEYALLYRACQRVVTETAVGIPQSFAMTTDRSKVLIQTLGPECFLLMSLDSDQPSGRARFEIARARVLLERDLV